MSRPLLVLVLALATAGCYSTRTLVLSPDPDPEVVEYLHGRGDGVRYALVDVSALALRDSRKSVLFGFVLGLSGAARQLRVEVVPRVVP